jgi:uncharacterized membrane protein YedE/YeeE
MQNFTPFASLCGGLLIGLSAAMMFVVNGKITGISGMFAGVVRPARTDTLWRFFFLAGLVVGGLLLRTFYPSAFAFGILRPPSALVVSGVLVGFGTRLGNGCTSGHGVCGASRLSARSVAATATFICSGALVVLFYQHLFGFAE